MIRKCFAIFQFPIYLKKKVLCDKTDACIKIAKFMQYGTCITKPKFCLLEIFQLLNSQSKKNADWKKGHYAVPIQHSLLLIRTKDNENSIRKENKRKTPTWGMLCRNMATYANFKALPYTSSVDGLGVITFGRSMCGHFVSE